MPVPILCHWFLGTVEVVQVGAWSWGWALEFQLGLQVSLNSALGACIPGGHPSQPFRHLGRGSSRKKVPTGVPCLSRAARQGRGVREGFLDICHGGCPS